MSDLMVFEARARPWTGGPVDTPFVRVGGRQASSIEAAEIFAALQLPGAAARDQGVLIEVRETCSEISTFVEVKARTHFAGRRTTYSQRGWNV